MSCLPPSPSARVAINTRYELSKFFPPSVRNILFPLRSSALNTAALIAHSKVNVSNLNSAILSFSSRTLLIN